MLRHSLSSFLLTLSLPVFGAERVKVDISSTVEKNQVKVSFKVSSSSPLKLNLEAPWKLKLGEKSSELFEKTLYTKADFQTQVPGFVIHTKKVSQDNVSYELTAYSCTSDGSQCFHDVLKGNFSTTASNKK